MDPNVKKSTTSNSLINEGQNLSSTNDSDQILLKALEDLIVCVVGLKQMNDINQIPLGPEAGKLVTALRDFISSVVGRSEPMSQNTVVKVSLDEDNNILQGDGGEDRKDHEDGDEISLTAISSTKVHRDETRASDSQRLAPSSSENPQAIFLDKLLKRLQEHVFNTMPIRMLSFEPTGSSLRIVLVERGAIYARLASLLRKKIPEVDRDPIFRASLQKMKTEQEAIDWLISEYARYAILSHTWLGTSAEVTYGDWNKGLFSIEDPGYQKLVNFCKVAWKAHGLTLGWMDSVCINKESSSELDESIRSMYSWYRRANVCITYLAETRSLSTMHNDRWFTRGWTLQELLAPRITKFYDSGWNRLIDNSNNDKDDTTITAQIKQATTMSKKELDFIRSAPISRRMQLAARRQVTREEDTAYSLMGIFDVSISTAYGEGAERAFFRLLHEILVSRRDVLDIFNWAGDLSRGSRLHSSSILPSSPLHYLESYQFRFQRVWPVEPLTLTHLGLRMPVILMSIISIPGDVSPYVPIGDYSATVDISPVGVSWDAPDATYNLLDNRISGRGGRKETGGYQLTLAVFSFFGDVTSIYITKPSTAKVLIIHEDTDVGKVTSSSPYNIIYTNAPVVFDLTNVTNRNDTMKWNKISRDELAKHGMQLINLYL